MPARRTTVALATVTALSALVLAACGSSEEDEPEAAPGTAAPTSAAGPITLTDARGKQLVLDQPATKVVSLEWGLTEQVASLGVMPIGVADVKGYGNWVSAEKLATGVTDVGTRSEPSVDTIARLDPDLVVTTDDSAATLITQLEKLAPVLVIKGNDNSDPIGYVKRGTTLLGQALGKTTEATALNAGLDTAITEGKARLAAAGLDGKQVAIADGYQEGSAISLRVFTEGSLLGALAGQLGLKEAWNGDGDPAYGLAQADVEALTQLGDVEFLYIANDADGGDVFGDGLKDNAVWKNLPFVKAGNVTRLPDGTWMFGGPKSAEAFISSTITALTA